MVACGLLPVFLLLLLAPFLLACSNVGHQMVFHDPSCSHGQSLGCNAGGQGENCRFCGFSNFPPCPGSNTNTNSNDRPSLNSGSCSDVGSQRVYHDPACSAGQSVGCNAGGQGQNCRFCGFGQFPPCPTPSAPTCNDDQRYDANTRSCVARCNHALRQEWDAAQGRCVVNTDDTFVMRPYHCQNMADFARGGCVLRENYCIEHKMDCARFYAPLIKFHPDEYLWPSSVDNYLAHAFLGKYEFKEQCNGFFFSELCTTCLVPKVIRDDIRKEHLRGDSSWNPSNDNLDDAIFLIPDDRISAGHSFLNANGFPSYIRGTRPGNVPIYVRFKSSGNRLVISYNIFFPFNAGKSFGVARFGNHFGDWEDVQLLVEDSRLSRVYVHAHGSENAYDWHFSDGRVRKFGTHRPVVYIAHLSHGTYLAPGTDNYRHLFLGIHLKDDTADGGTQWQSWENVQEMSWEFKGRWGTRNQHYGSRSLRNTCVLDADGGDTEKLTDGPQDPNYHGRSSGFRWL